MSTQSARSFASVTLTIKFLVLIVSLWYIQAPGRIAILCFLKVLVVYALYLIFAISNQKRGTQG